MNQIIEIRAERPALALRLRAIRALAAAHGMTNETTVTKMRAALRRIVEIADGDTT